MCRACYERYDSDDERWGCEEDSEGETLPRPRGLIVKQPLQDEICNAIDNVSQDIQGNWASGGPLSGPFADPRLSVDEFGPIGFPLSETDAQKIIAASHQAPFGMKEQTIVDTEVRRTWEINTADIAIENRAFRQLVRNTVRTAMCELGVASSVPVRADLYKLLLYEKGAMFKPHVDSEKAPGMFATMIICLPSPHVGGDVCLKHDRSSMRLSTAELQPSYLCWYSNVEHEVKPVLEGYRLLLTYDLVRTDLEEHQDNAPVIKSNPFDSKQFLPLQAALQKWIQLAIKELPPKDMLPISQKRKHCNISGRSMVLLCSLLRWDALYMMGECETFDDVIELKKVFDVSGTLLVSGVPTKEENVLQSDVFSSEREPDDHEHEGYTGNAGAEDSYWYRDTVLVLVRDDMLAEFLTRCFREKIRTIAYRREESRGNASSLIQALTSRQHRRTLREVCSYILQANLKELLKMEQRAKSSATEDKAWMRSQPFDDAVMGCVVWAALGLKSVQMMVLAVRCVKYRLPEHAINAIRRMKTNLTNPDDQEKVLQSLDQAVEGYKSIFERYKLLSGIIASNDEDKGWAIESLVRVLEESTKADEQDGRLCGL